MKKILFFLSILIFAVFGIMPVYSQSSSRAEANAKEAWQRLEEALDGRSTNSTGSSTGGSTNSSSGSTGRRNAPPVQVTTGGAMPNWVNNPSASYPRNQYIAAVGDASNRQDAEIRALANLISIFGIEVQANSYSERDINEALNNNTVTVTGNVRLMQQITTATTLKTLIGAEIGGVWDDGRGTTFGLAFIENERTIAIYTELIRINQINIDTLTEIPINQKNTFDGYARYKLASYFAGVNSQYARIISFAGGTTANLTFSRADGLLLEAQEIIKNISVGITVINDSSNRIRDSFAKVLNNEGLRTQGSNPPFVLEVTVQMNEATFQGNTNIFCRYTVSANLIERSTGSVLLPFSFTGREGQKTYLEAQNRAYISIERTVAREYPAIFKEYLESLVPDFHD